MDQEVLKIISAVSPNIGDYIRRKLGEKSRFVNGDIQTILLAKIIEQNDSVVETLKTIGNTLTNHIVHEEKIITELCTAFRETRAELIRKGFT